MEVAREVESADSLYERCQELFSSFPLAASSDDDDSIRSMVLALREGKETGYFALSQYTGAGCYFSLCRWPTGSAVAIRDDVTLSLPGEFEGAIIHGVPIPKDGSLLGWKHGNVIDALIAVYTECAPESPEPCWSVMPRMDSREVAWPPFTGEPLIDHSFWELFRTGRIVSLEDLIAQTADTVFWAETDSTLGSASCVVTRDVRSPEGYILRSGIYVYYRVLRAGIQIPSPQAILSGSTSTDLTVRFRG
jgi:hypothetical protein